MDQVCGRYKSLIWLDRQAGPIRLDERTTLVGTGGWGIFPCSTMGTPNSMTSSRLRSCKQLRGPALAQYHQRLAHASAEIFRPKLEAALGTSDQVVIGTHVPAVSRGDLARRAYLRTSFPGQILQCNSGTGH